MELLLIKEASAIEGIDGRSISLRMMKGEVKYVVTPNGKIRVIASSLRKFSGSRVDPKEVLNLDGESTISEAMWLLKVTRSTINKWIRAKKVRVTRKMVPYITSRGVVYRKVPIIDNRSLFLSGNI